MLNIDTDLTARSAVGVQMRKAISGEYRVYLGIGTSFDAILIQCIGQFISVNNKTALDSAWSSSTLQLEVWAHKPEEARNVMLPCAD